MKKIVIGILAVSAMFLLSGCGAKPSVTSKGRVLGDAPILHVIVSNGAGAPSYGYNESKAFRNVLEASAEGTLSKGYKYFAIMSPKAIANTKGSLKNTVPELIEKCSASSAMALSLTRGNMRECGVRNTSAGMQIALYNEEQLDFTVIDAQAAIDYMKANGLYDGNGIEEKLE